jgi:2-polyprenyl-6-methoxyphenol hydroxylase-like FAD-dependent oxidoreductase
LGGLDTLLDLSTLDSRFPFTLFLPQATTERLIEERALELGVDIRRGHLVEKVEQDTDSVIIRGRNGETPFGFAARYAAGADGARSIVRHALAIDFVGHPARHTMTLADVVLDAPPERPVLTLVNEAGGLVLAPRGDGVHHRIGVIDASSPYLAPSEPVSLAEVAACAAAFSAGISVRAILFGCRASQMNRASPSATGKGGFSWLAMPLTLTRRWAVRA